MNRFQGLLRGLAVTFILLSAADPSALGEPASPPQPAVVFAKPAIQLELFDSLTYPVRVVPKAYTTLLADTDGVVSRIHLPLGQKVARKQSILKITHTDPIYQYAPIAVLSPINGIVSSMEVTEGSQVTKGQKLASVTDPSKIQLVMEVPATDLPYLRPKMPGEFKVSGQNQNILVPVRIRGISPFVDSATGTATGELEVVSQPALTPGLLGQVSFRANLHQGFSIVDAAVVYKGKDTFVRIVEGGKAKQIPVTLGKRSRGSVEVLTGLKEKMMVVERSSRYVADGDPVSLEDLK